MPVPDPAFLRMTPGSAALYERAVRVMPGGDTRTCVYQAPHILAMERGRGSFIWDVDGNRYIDLYYNGLSLLHGHAYGPAIEAIARQIIEGTAWAGSSRPQVEFAEMLCDRVPSAELVRFCVSGSEAAMLAAKLSRRATGRRLLVRTASGYHGSYDGFDEDSGILIVPDGDLEALERLLDERGDEIAAVFLEPVSVATTLSPPVDYFVRAREATRAKGVVLVFDECITFRNAWGGVQETLGVIPDLTLLAKFIGGGLPLGALAGSREIMEHFDPRSPSHLYHSGSFNGYVAACAAGLAVLGAYTREVISNMNSRTERLAGLFAAAAADVGVTMAVDHSGSMIGLQLGVAQASPIITPESLNAYRLLQHAALIEGLYMQPAEGVLGLATSFGDDLVDEVAERMHRALLRTRRWIDRGV